MAWRWTRLWDLFIALSVLRHTSGHRGAEQKRLDLANLLLFPKHVQPEPLQPSSQLSPPVAKPSRMFVGYGGVPPSHLLDSSSRFVTQLQRQGVYNNIQQGFLKAGSSSSWSVARVGASSSQPAQQQGSFWTSFSKSNYRSGRRREFPVQLASPFQTGPISKPLSQLENLEGGFTSTSPGTSANKFSSPGLHAPQGESPSSSHPLLHLKTRLFTTQGATVSSNNLKPLHDVQQSGSHSLTVLSQSLDKLQTPGSFQPAQSQVQSAPIGQPGAQGTRFYWFSPASPVYTPLKPSPGLFSNHGAPNSQVSQQKLAVLPTGSAAGIAQPQQSSTAQLSSSGFFPAAVSSSSFRLLPQGPRNPFFKN